jgi:hypothetical protein
MRRVFFVLMCVAAFVLPLCTSAHGLGLSWERQVGDHTVDIGYDPVPMEDTRLLLDFELWGDTEKTIAVEYDRIWVRMQIAGQTIFATGIGKAPLGPTTLLLLLPQGLSGEAEILVRYEKEGAVIAEALFPMTVAPMEQKASESLPLLVLFVIGLTIGCGAMWYVLRRRSLAH